MTSRASHRQILWATSVIGGATFGALLIGLVRNKAIALIGGPGAIGLFGLFTALVGTCGSIAAVGLDTSAVRQLSSSIERPAKAAKVRWAIWTLAWPLAISGALAVWLFRGPLAGLVAGEPGFSDEIGWLGIGVAATVISVVQIAMLQSYGRIGDIARVRLWGSGVATCASVAAIYQFGVAGIVVAVIAIPLANVALALPFLARLPGYEGKRPSSSRLRPQWRALLAVGATVMLTYAVANVSGLGVRAVLTHLLGLQGVGLYQASQAILLVNLSLILNAMAADFYPRLAHITSDSNATRELLNQQVHVTLVLAAPALTIGTVAAALLLQLLYSSEFTDGALLLRLFVAAGIPRLVLWALGYVLLARGAAAAFLAGETAGALVVPLTWVLVSEYGLAGAGLAAIVANVLILSVYLRRARSFDIHLSGPNARYALFLFMFLLALAFLFQLSAWSGWILGLAGAAAISWRSLAELRSILRR